MSNEVTKTKAMKLASTGNTLSFVGLILSPVFCIVGVIMGIMAFQARSEEEKHGWSGNSVNNKALSAVIAGVLITAGWIAFVLPKILR